MTLHLFLSSLISFNNVFQLDVNELSSLWFMPKHFTLFHAALNGTVFLISCSQSSLLVYRKQVIFVPGFVPGSCSFAEFS